MFCTTKFDSKIQKQKKKIFALTELTHVDSTCKFDMHAICMQMKLQSCKLHGNQVIKLQIAWKLHASCNRQNIKCCVFRCLSTANDIQFANDKRTAD